MFLKDKQLTLEHSKVHDKAGGGWLVAGENQQDKVMYKTTCLSLQTTRKVK